MSNSYWSKIFNHDFVDWKIWEFLRDLQENLCLYSTVGVFWQIEKKMIREVFFDSQGTSEEENRLFFRRNV